MLGLVYGLGGLEKEFRFLTVKLIVRSLFSRGF